MKESMAFVSIFVCYNRNRTALGRELLSNKSQFIDQL